MTSTATGSRTAATAGSTNEVHLVGRVSAPPQERELPSGDVVVTVRLVVARPAPRPGRRGQLIDVIDVSCWTAATRRSALRLGEGDTAAVEGSLRRRFFRVGGGGVQSRYDVEASSVRREARASAS